MYPRGGSVAADVIVMPAPHGFVGRRKLPVNVPDRTSESPGCAASSAACRFVVTCTTRVAFANTGAGIALGNSATVARTVLVSGGGGGGGAVVVLLWTLNASEPTTPSTVALITAWPPATAVTTPELETLATLGAELDQVTVLPVTMAPL